MSEFDRGDGADRGGHHGAPAGFWSLIIGLAGVILAALGLYFGGTKTDRDETRKLEQRLCRLEARAGTGECKL